MKKYKIVLISGYARSGKDTFGKMLSEMNDNFGLYSFAHELKIELSGLVRKMGINIFDPTDAEKKIIRPIMISFGCAWREIDIDHWVKIVDAQTKNRPDTFIPVITDNRFLSESEYFIRKYGRENVLIVEIVREGIPTPPKEEIENQKFVSAIADERIIWENDPLLVKPRKLVADFYSKYFNRA